MKIKCKLLQEENGELKSQLDTMHKQSNRKLVEKYRDLAEKVTDKEQQDTDLVCTVKFGS